MVGTRKSHRIYTHAIVSPPSVHADDAVRYEYDHTATERPAGEGWERASETASWARKVSCAGEPIPARVVAYCGRLDLAEKKLASVRAADRRWGESHAVIVEVESDRGCEEHGLVGCGECVARPPFMEGT